MSMREADDTAQNWLGVAIIVAIVIALTALAWLMTLVAECGVVGAGIRRDRCNLRRRWSADPRLSPLGRAIDST